MEVRTSCDPFSLRKSRLLGNACFVLTSLCRRWGRTQVHTRSTVSSDGAPEPTSGRASAEHPQGAPASLLSLGALKTWASIPSKLVLDSELKRRCKNERLPRIVLQHPNRPSSGGTPGLRTGCARGQDVTCKDPPQRSR